jgi:hypothetical protein
MSEHADGSIGQLIIIILNLRFGLTVPSHGAFWLAQNKSKPQVQTVTPKAKPEPMDHQIQNEVQVLAK